MMAMEFAVECDGRLPAKWSPAGSADEEACAGDADHVVLFQTTRAGTLATAAGEVRIAALLQIERCGSGRLVATMLVALLKARSRWCLRRFCVPVDANCPHNAMHLLGALLPDALSDIPDGAMMMSGDDGVVVAEVLSRSGRLSRTGLVDIDLRGPGRRADAGGESRARAKLHQFHA